jgi:hypothetical protein
MDPVRHLRFSIAPLIAVIAMGTLGYSLIESWPFFDAFYMTVITLSTVGFKQVDGHIIFNPLPDKVIESGSILITLVEQPAINQLEKLAAGYQP